MPIDFSDPTLDITSAEAELLRQQEAIKALRGWKPLEQGAQPQAFQSAVTGTTIAAPITKKPLLSSLSPLIADTVAGREEKELIGQKSMLNRYQDLGFQAHQASRPQAVRNADGTVTPADPNKLREWSVQGRTKFPKYKEYFEGQLKNADTIEGDSVKQGFDMLKFNWEQGKPIPLQGVGLLQPEVVNGVRTGKYYVGEGTGPRVEFKSENDASGNLVIRGNDGSVWKSDGKGGAVRVASGPGAAAKPTPEMGSGTGPIAGTQPTLNPSASGTIPAAPVGGGAATAPVAPQGATTAQPLPPQAPQAPQPGVPTVNAEGRPQMTLKNGMTVTMDATGGKVFTPAAAKPKDPSAVATAESIKADETDKQKREGAAGMLNILSDINPLLNASTNGQAKAALTNLAGKLGYSTLDAQAMEAIKTHVLSAVRYANQNKEFGSGNSITERDIENMLQIAAGGAQDSAKARATRIAGFNAAVTSAERAAGLNRGEAGLHVFPLGSRPTGFSPYNFSPKGGAAPTAPKAPSPTVVKPVSKLGVGESATVGGLTIKKVRD